ncbi:MAG: 16S rRNA (cytosine(1402)-N(4))-methyltransferase, partial [Deltaproteobacteria bacterium]
MGGVRRGRSRGAGRYGGVGAPSTPPQSPRCAAHGSFVAHNLTDPPHLGTHDPVPDGFHAPVLAAAVVAWAKGPLAVPPQPPRGTYVDATCGGGGHAEAIVTRLRPARGVLIDRDPAALAHARERLTPLLAGIPTDFVHAQFAQTCDVLDRLGV